MKQRVVQTLWMGTVLAVSVVLNEVRGDDDFYGRAEPSHHVMHIRKLSDGDNLKIELEPVWFHLESAEQRAADGSQQVKRQAKQNPVRPVKIYSSLKDLERHPYKNQHRSDAETESVERETTESFLKDFWHADVPTVRERSEEVGQTPTSLKQQLEDIELPGCFRRYLHEMYDRNNESVRKLMRCLGQHQEETCNEARRAQRVQPYRGRENRENDPQQALYGRRVIRRRKFSDHNDNPPEDVEEEEDLKFEKHFIRSDSDDVGQIFTPGTDKSDSEAGSDESSSTDEATDQVREDRTSSEESDEPDRREQPKYDPREPYRRPPPTYNTHKKRRESMESEQDSSGEDSESCEDC